MFKYEPQDDEEFELVSVVCLLDDSFAVDVSWRDWVCCATWTSLACSSGLNFSIVTRTGINCKRSWDDFKMKNFTTIFFKYSKFDIDSARSMFLSIRRISSFKTVTCSVRRTLFNSDSLRSSVVFSKRYFVRLSSSSIRCRSSSTSSKRTCRGLSTFDVDEREFPNRTFSNVLTATSVDWWSLLADSEP